MSRTAEAADVAQESPGRADLPIGSRGGRRVLLAAVFLCAACGLVYELALITLGGYLTGNAVTQTSVVLAVALCAMGLGALGAKPLSRRPVAGFASVEVALALVGGLSVPALYAAFAWLDLFLVATLVASAAIGVLIGAEIPLLMALVQRIRAQEASAAVADLSAADYLGALVGGLAFPFLLLPTLGLLRGTLAVAVLNVLAAWVVGGWLFGRHDSRASRRAIALGCAFVVTVLGLVAVLAGRFELSARQALYSDPIVAAERSAYQEIVLTEALTPWRGRRDVRLFLNGDLQFSSLDEYRYHESLVHPAMAGDHERVLVLGGGDGLAVREVLRHPQVRRVVVVDLDPRVVRLATEDPRVGALNQHAFDDPRVEVVAADALAWLRGAAEPFDVILADLPDPDSTETAKLYSAEFYALVRDALGPGGRVAVQAGSPYFAADAYWCVEASLAAAGLRTAPYHVDVPSFGDWGFVLAAEQPPALRLPDPSPAGLRFLDADVLTAAAVFPADTGRRPVRPSTLLDPVILRYQRRGWSAA